MISDDNDCLHFIFDQVKVDINIFSIKDEVVYCKWVVLNKGYFNRLKYFILGCNLSNKIYIHLKVINHIYSTYFDF